jgi:hypothetical protein
MQGWPASPEWVAGFAWNPRPASRGMGGQLPRNTHPGIRVTALLACRSVPQHANRSYKVVGSVPRTHLTRACGAFASRARSYKVWVAPCRSVPARESTLGGAPTSPAPAARSRAGLAPTGSGWPPVGACLARESAFDLGHQRLGAPAARSRARPAPTARWHPTGGIRATTAPGRLAAGSPPRIAPRCGDLLPCAARDRGIRVARCGPEQRPGRAVRAW